MAATSSSRNRSEGPGFSPFRRPPLSSSDSFASSTSSSFSSCSSSTFFARTTSPTRLSLYGRRYSDADHSVHRSSPSVRFSIDSRPISPNRSISFTRQIGKTGNAASYNSQKRTCACSPTTHPGSFRCALHKRANNYRSHKTTSLSSSSSYHSSSRLNYRRSAMTNSLVRIGGVEGELVKRALSALIRPSSHQQRRRAAFEPRPSRLSVMSKAEDL